MDIESLDTLKAAADHALAGLETFRAKFMADLEDLRVKTIADIKVMGSKLLTQVVEQLQGAVAAELDELHGWTLRLSRPDEGVSEAIAALDAKHKQR